MSFPIRIALRATSGQYFRAEGGGGQIVGTSGTSIGPWETFTTVDRGGGQLALQASNGMYLSAQNGGGSVLTATATAITPWETFAVIDRGAGQVALRASNGMYLRAEPVSVSAVTVTATTIGATETFAMIDPGIVIGPRFGAYDWSAPVSLPQPGRGVVSFTATAQRDVYVGISSVPGTTSQLYEIVFSAGGNMTVLRRGPQGPSLGSSGLGLLTPGGSNALWVAIDSTTRTIQAGRGTPGQSPILSFYDPAFVIGAQYVAFTSGDTPLSISNVQRSAVTMALTFSDAPPTAVHLGNPLKLNITNRISIAAWIYPTATDGLRNIVARGYVLSPAGEVLLRIQNGCYEVGSGNGTAHIVSVPIPPADLGTWVHLAGVYDGTTWTLYRNGQVVGQKVDPIGAVPVTAGWSIGSRGNVLERSFRGMISAVSIWNTAIDANLLQACMACSLTGLEPGLAGYWPLADGAGSVAMDKAPAPAPGNLVQAIWTLCPPLPLPAAPPPIIAPPPPPPPAPFEQDKWSRCTKCQAMFYSTDAGSCVAGGAHVGTGSFNYRLFAFGRPDGQGQRSFYKCGKCAELFYYDVRGPASVCPAGNTHDNAGSAEYWMTAQEQPGVLAQNAWLWCWRCQGIYFSGGTPLPCPAGGAHASQGSANYVVKYDVPPSTGTGTAQPATGLPPQSGDPSIDSQLTALAQTGIPFSIFGVPFTMPIRFSGAIQSTITADSANYIGSARLDSPFSVDVGRLEVKVSRAPLPPQAYLRFDLPLSISSLIQSQVQPKVPGAAWTAIDALAMPLLRCFDTPTVVLSPINSTDPTLPGPITQGINFYKSISLASIEPFTTLNATFPVLRLEQRSIGAHLGIGRDNGAINWQGDLALVLNQSLGTDVVVLKSISMTMSPGIGTLSAGAKVLFLVRVSDSQTLQFQGGINLNKTEIGASASVWGSLDAEPNAWRDPLGLKGLTIKGLGIEIGASTVFPNIKLGFRGDVYLGDAALQAQIGFLFDPADIGSTILQLASPTGIGLLALLKALLPASLAPPVFFDLGITDLNIYVAPKGGSIAGKAYAKGTQISGKLNLWGYRAAIDGMIDYTSGAALNGTMDRISLKAGGITFVELTDVAGTGDPTISIDVNTRKQSIHISGKLRLLDGLVNESCEADIGSSGLSLTISSSASGIFASASVRLDSSGFALSVTPSFSFGFSLFGVDISVGVQAKIAVAASAAAFSQTIGFSFRAFGVDVNAGSVTLNVPIGTFGELRSVFEQFADIVRDFFKNKLLGGLQAACAWLRDNLSLAVSEAGQLIRSAGVAIADAAKALVDVFKAAVTDAVRAVARTLDEAVNLLRNTFGVAEAEIENFALNVGNVFTGGIAAVGSVLGFGSSSSPKMPAGSFQIRETDYNGNRQWYFDTPGRGAISFSACYTAAAKIVISPTPTVNDPMYEIEIGMENNTRIYVRRSRGGAVVASAPGSLNSKGDRFWVAIDGSYGAGRIQVGRGAVGTNVLLSYSDPAFITDAKYVFFGRSMGMPGFMGNTIWYWDFAASQVETRLCFGPAASAVQLGNPQKLDIRGPISISAWIRPLATDGLRNIVARGYQLSPAGEVFLRIFDGNYQFGAWNGGDHKVSVPIPTGDLGNWVHLTGTYDGKAWTLYHNGHFLARAVDPIGAVPVSGGWAIGSCGDRSERCFSGYIAEVSIWNKAVDLQTIDRLLQRQVGAPIQGLVGYWPLGQNFESFDLSGGFLGSNLVSHTMNYRPQSPLGELLGTPMQPADGVLSGTAWNLVPPIPAMQAPAVTNPGNQAWSRTPVGPAPASPWTGLGGKLEGNPAIISCSPGRLNILSRGPTRELFHIGLGDGWGVWEGLGGQIQDDPSPSTRGNGLLDVFVRGMDNQVYVRWWDGGSWQGYAALGGSVATGPVALTPRPTHRDFFALGTDKAIWWRYVETDWSPLKSLGGGLLDAPSVVFRDGRYDVFARGLDLAIYQYSIVNGQLGTWQFLGGGCIGPPAAVSTAAGCFDVFARGTDQRVWTRSFRNQGWSAWSSLAAASGPDPGALASDPVAISISPDRIDVLARGADQRLWHRRQLAGVWQPWRQLGTLPILSKPSVTSSAPGRLDIAVYSPDKALWHYRMED